MLERSLTAFLLSFAFAASAAFAVEPLETVPADTLTLRPLAEPSTQSQALIQSLNSFGWKVFREVYMHAGADENIFFSPISLSYALGMSLNGARGATLDSLRAALELHDLSLDEINASYREIKRMLEAGDSTVTLTIANSLWHRKSKHIKIAFVKSCSENYAATVEGVNFGLRSTPKKINAWISQNTGGKITNAVADPLERDIAALIINAIYFKAPWALEFDTTRTRPFRFYLKGGDSIICPMMWRDWKTDTRVFRNSYKDHPIGQFHDGVFDGVTIPYGTAGFVLTAVVPDTLTTLDSALPSLSATKLVEWGKINTSPECGGYGIMFPRLKLNWNGSLAGPLKALGLANAFAADADFGAMFDDGVGFLNDIQQSSCIQIDEHGTESAVESDLMYGDRAEPVVLFNRPFIFCIQDRTSGMMLFVGKIGKPAWED